MADLPKLEIIGAFGLRGDRFEEELIWGKVGELFYEFFHGEECIFNDVVGAEILWFGDDEEEC